MSAFTHGLIRAAESTALGLANTVSGTSGLLGKTANTADELGALVHKTAQSSVPSGQYLGGAITDFSDIANSATTLMAKFAKAVTDSGNVLGKATNDTVALAGEITNTFLLNPVKRITNSFQIASDRCFNWIDSKLASKKAPAPTFEL